MKHVLARATTHLSAIITGVVVLALAVVLVVASQAHADNGNDGKGTLVTIHDRGNETVVLSDAHTIGEVLSEEGIEVSDQDVVEPSVDQEMVASEYQVNIYHARPVIVVDGSTRQRVMTPYQTAEQITKSVGITLYSEDKTTITRSDDIIADGAALELQIDRATAFSFQLFGKKTIARTQALTIGDMLKEKGITLGKDDRVSPNPNTMIEPDMKVTVWREGKQTVTIEESIPFEVKKIHDADRPVGYSSLQLAGKEGSRDVTYQIEIRDGKEVKRTEIASLVVTQPTTQVEVIGTYIELSPGYASDRVAIMTSAGIAAKDQGYAAYIIDHENASWCPTRWQGQIGCPSSYLALYAENADVGYGLCQATPGNKMASAGADWRTNPVTQMRWCADYAISRYGSWSAAYNFKVANGWW